MASTGVSPLPVCLLALTQGVPDLLSASCASFIVSSCRSNEIVHSDNGNCFSVIAARKTELILIFSGSRLLRLFPSRENIASVRMTILAARISFSIIERFRKANEAVRYASGSLDE